MNQLLYYTKPKFLGGTYEIDACINSMLTSRKKKQELNNKQLRNWKKESGEFI